MTLASSFSRRAVIVAAALAALGWAAPARANGRYPASGQIALAPQKGGSVLMVRATYGLMISQDTGKSWQWICEPAVGYGNVEDPMLALTAEGTILAGIFEGLSVGSADGCQWSFFPGLVNKYVIDLSVDKTDATKGVLIISNSVGEDDAGQEVFLTQLWQTADSGKSWAQTGVNLPPEFLGLTVDSAPSNAQRVYLSGRLGAPDYPGVLERTDDRGATWQSLPIAGADSTHLPYIGAVDPTNPDVIYVRLDSDPGDTLVVSKDGGMTWSTVFTAPGKLLGFALSPDGTTVAIGSPGVVLDGGATTGAGVWTAPASTLQFTQVSGVGAMCLTWAASGLYACADEFKDKFTAGVSTDQGKTFTALLHLGELCPLVCAEADSGVNQLCPAEWPNTASTISAVCDAGTGGGGDGGPGGGGTGGCACSLSGTGAGGAAALTLGLVAAWARSLRERSRRRRRTEARPARRA